MPTPIPNPQAVSLTEILSRLQRRYPRAVIKKPFLSGEIISIPVDDYRLFVRNQPKRGRLMLDFAPPTVWMLVGMLGLCFIASFILSMAAGQPVYAVGGLFILAGFLITKAVFKNSRKQELANFETAVQSALQPGDDSSVF